MELNITQVQGIHSAPVAWAVEAVQTFVSTVQETGNAGLILSLGVTEDASDRGRLDRAVKTILGDKAKARSTFDKALNQHTLYIKGVA